MTKITVQFEFTTGAQQNEAVLRRSLRETLDGVADRYAGEVVPGSVEFTLDEA